MPSRSRCRHHQNFEPKKILEEIAAMQMVSHRNCVEFHKAFEDDTAIFLVEELVTGGELLDRIAESMSFTEADVGHVISQLFSAVEYLHSVGICHRDIKPSNILMVSNDPQSPDFNRVKLCDFGLAHIFPNKDAKRSQPTMSALCGTPMYMAPEIAQGIVQESNKNKRRSKDSRHDGKERDAMVEIKYTNVVDVWSIGVIHYVMMSGYQPFFNWNDLITGDYSFDFPEWEGVSPETMEFISFCLERDPMERPTARECLNHPWICAHELWGQCSLASKEVLQQAVSSGGDWSSIKCKLQSALSYASGQATIENSPTASSPQSRVSGDFATMFESARHSSSKSRSTECSKNSPLSRDHSYRSRKAMSSEAEFDRQLAESFESLRFDSTQRFPKRSDKSDSWVATSRSSSPVRPSKGQSSSRTSSRAASPTRELSESKMSSPMTSPKSRHNRGQPVPPIITPRFAHSSSSGKELPKLPRGESHRRVDTKITSPMNASPMIAPKPRSASVGRHRMRPEDAQINLLPSIIKT